MAQREGFRNGAIAMGTEAFPLGNACLPYAFQSTINLDDTLLDKARSLTGTKETAALVRQALETLVRVESGKRLIALGGTMPDAEAAPRRRSTASK